MKLGKKMRLMLTLCLLGIASGCASNPIDLPDWDIPEAVGEVQNLRDLPDLPPSADLQCLAPDVSTTLTRYVIIAGGNYTVGIENTAALVDMNKAYDSLASAGRGQKEFAKIRDEQLTQERRDHFVDNMWHRALIIALAIGLAL